LGEEGNIRYRVEREKKLDKKDLLSNGQENVYGTQYQTKKSFLQNGNMTAKAKRWHYIGNM
jgi:hypothetical protein